MANIKSQKKRNLQNERARLRNKAVRSNLHTQLKKVDTAIAKEDMENLPELARKAQKALDVAAQKKVIHKNKAARVKARVAQKVHAATQ